MKKIILILIGAIVIIVAGFSIALLWPSLIQKNELNKPIGGEKDEHGCLIAAGYSWCEAKQKCLRVWEEGCGITNQPASRENVPQDKETCEAKKGQWGRSGLTLREQCNLPTSDAGKTCRNQEECEGTCIADLSQEEQDRIINQKEIIETNGRCTSWLLMAGTCEGYVKDGKVDGILCVD